MSRDVDRFRPYFDKEPDQRLTLTVKPNSLPLATVQFMNVDTAYFAPGRVDDAMPDMNWLSTSKQVRWILREDATGKENMDIEWRVKQGSVVKLRIFNDPKSFHPMQHPIHLHGQRMLVVSRDGVQDAQPRVEGHGDHSGRRRRSICSSTRRTRAPGCSTATSPSISGPT